MTKEHQVSNEDGDIRLDRWFKRHYPGLQHALLEKYLRKGDVRLDGKKAKSSDRVFAGQTIRCPDIVIDPDSLKKRKPTHATPQDLAEIKKWVLYRDDNVIVINKPPGLAVQGGTKQNKSVDDMLDGLMFDNIMRPKLVHRLDKDTSGALVLARNAKAAAALAKTFSGKTMEKIYWAIVIGSPLPMHGTIDSPLAKMGDDETSYEVVGVDNDEGKYAVTEYRVLDSLARKYALMELKPLTGRTHQLRVHMTSIGCPILGDRKYGGSSAAGESLGIKNALHLHARRIVIPPIMGGKKIDVTAPLPAHMKNSFQAFGLDIPKV